MAHVAQVFVGDQVARSAASAGKSLCSSDELCGLGQHEDRQVRHQAAADADDIGRCGRNRLFVGDDQQIRRCTAQRFFDVFKVGDPSAADRMSGIAQITFDVLGDAFTNASRPAQRKLRARDGRWFQDAREVLTICACAVATMESVVFEFVPVFFSTQSGHQIPRQTSCQLTHQTASPLL